MQHKSSRAFCWLRCLLTYSHKCFMTLLEKGLLPDIEAKCGRHKWTLQHDGAPAHTVRNTMEYLEKEKIDFIETHIWPPNSSDLNPVDYAVWGALQQRVYHGRKFKTVEELKQTIVTE